LRCRCRCFPCTPARDVRAPRVSYPQSVPPIFGDEAMQGEMIVADVKAQVERLDKLPRGLMKEEGLWRGANAQALNREHKAYLVGIREALAGAEEGSRRKGRAGRGQREAVPDQVGQREIGRPGRKPAPPRSL